MCLAACRLLSGLTGAKKTATCRWGAGRYRVCLASPEEAPPVAMEVDPITDAKSESKTQSPPKSRVWATVQRIMRARITAGVITVLPIWIAFLIVKFIFEASRDMSLWVVVRYLRSPWGATLVESWGVDPAVLDEQGITALSTGWQWAVGGFCVFLTMFFLYVVGVLTANILGRRMVKGLESLVDRVPLVKTVYRASKQILQAFTGEDSRDFQRVALIPYPSMEVRSIGFITAITKDSQTGEELCTCFLATTPNPTTGYVFVLRRSDVIELDWDVEEAISVIMSGGALVPPTMPLVVGIPVSARSVTARKVDPGETPPAGGTAPGS